MREIFGLELFLDADKGGLTAEVLAELVRQDLAHSHLQVYAESLDEQQTVLADLTIANGEIHYDGFAKRLEMIFIGSVLDDAIPLTYRIKGKQLLIRGRCSVIPKVCGVDLYFAHYLREKNSQARQKIIFSMPDLLKQLKGLGASSFYK
ncbi:MAG: hypothetical protein IBX55_13245 [Methyloprofundus sp.]|nr:hypothetical protein [Methyloprofundus sp.]MBW6453256.1 hypothetical protein [Methyloprofundus sp.]